jgi:hypothetical protein
MFNQRQATALNALQKAFKKCADANLLLFPTTSGDSGELLAAKRLEMEKHLRSTDNPNADIDALQFKQIEVAQVEHAGALDAIVHFG